MCRIALRLLQPTTTQANDVVLLFSVLIFCLVFTLLLNLRLFFRKKDKQEQQLREKTEIENAQTAVNNPNSSLWIIGVVLFIGGAFIMFTNVLFALLPPHEVSLCVRFSGCTTYDIYTHPKWFLLGVLEWFFFTLGWLCCTTL